MRAATSIMKISMMVVHAQLGAICKGGTQSGNCTEDNDRQHCDNEDHHGSLCLAGNGLLFCLILLVILDKGLA